MGIQSSSISRAALASASALGLLLAISLVGCATKPKTPAEAQVSSIQAEATGLTPSGDERFKSLDFALLFGDRESIATWSIAILDLRQKTAVKTASGDGQNLPDKYSWDGTMDSGSIAPEGTYVANLSITYGGKFQPSVASSKSFILDIAPPAASFSPNPVRFAYSPSGVPAPVALTIAAKSGLAKPAAWSLDIFDASGIQVKSLAGAFPVAKASWDGKLESGAYVQTAKTYPALLTVADEFGNKGSFKGSFAVADVPSPEPSAISTRRDGFSPTSASVKNSLDLLLSFGSKASVQSWQVEVSGVEKGKARAVRDFKGSAPDLPEYIRWDGKDDSGQLVPEGSYFATLSVDYGKAYTSTGSKSRPFSVIMTPPTGSITVDPPSVSLAALGPKRPVDLTVQAKSAYGRIASWVMAVYDPNKVSVAVFNGNWPANKIAWDGRTVEGGSLVPGTSYTVVAKVQDEYGNVGSLGGSLAVEGLGAATEPSSIEAQSTGFAPTGDGSAGTMAFKIAAGDASSVASWKVDMVSDRNVVERSFKGSGKQLPTSLSWDGKIDDGSYAPEGRYSAMLSLDYGVAFAPVSVETSPFVLDLSPPEGSISLSSELFSPDEEGAANAETFTLAGSSKLARIVGWSLTVYDPGNAPFIGWKGTWPSAPVVWDGKSQAGELVESAADYPLSLKLRDEYGNVGMVKRTLPTDILVLKSGDGYRIRVSSILFKPFTADFRDLPADRAARNLATLDLLAAKLKLPKFLDYKIKLEGHAVMINWDDREKGAAEQQAVLLPLSQSRAVAINTALVERGIAAERLVTQGVGAKDQVVPDSDYANRWKNRRVEFYLLK